MLNNHKAKMARKYNPLNQRNLRFLFAALHTSPTPEQKAASYQTTEIFLRSLLSITPPPRSDSGPKTEGERLTDDTSTHLQRTRRTSAPEPMQIKTQTPFWSISTQRTPQDNRLPSPIERTVASSLTPDKRAFSQPDLLSHFQTTKRKRVPKKQKHHAKHLKNPQESRKRLCKSGQINLFQTIKKHNTPKQATTIPYSVKDGVLDLSNRALKDNDIVKLVDNIKRHHVTINELNLASNTINRQSGLALARLTNVISIDLSGSHLSDETAQHLLYTSHFQAIILNNNPLTSDAFKPLSTRSNRPPLKRLEAKFNPDIGAQALEDILSNFTTLQHLDLSNCKTIGREGLTGTLLAKSSSLRTLALGNCGLHNRDIPTILAQPGIEHLMLYENNYLTDSAVILIADRPLITISLANCSRLSANAISLFSANAHPGRRPTLTDLRYSKNKVTANALSILSNGTHLMYAGLAAMKTRPTEQKATEKVRQDLYKRTEQNLSNHKRALKERMSTLIGTTLFGGKISSEASPVGIILHYLGEGDRQTILDNSASNQKTLSLSK
jgi:hypothetical protein